MKDGLIEWELIDSTKVGNDSYKYMIPGPLDWVSDHKQLGFLR